MRTVQAISEHGGYSRGPADEGVKAMWQCCFIMMGRELQDPLNQICLVLYLSAETIHYVPCCMGLAFWQSEPCVPRTLSSYFSNGDYYPRGQATETSSPFYRWRKERNTSLLVGKQA